MNFHITDINAPQEYDELLIQVFTFQIWDNIPTDVNVRIKCLNANGEVIHSVANCMHTFIGFSKSDACLRDLRWIFFIFNKIPLPAKKIRVEIGDLSSYLIFTNQIYPPHELGREWIRKAKICLRNTKMPVEVVLADTELTTEYEQWHFTNREEKRVTPPTLEHAGVYVDKEYKKNQNVRMELGLWN